MSVGYYPHGTQAFGLRAVGFSPSQGRWPWHAFGVTLCALEAQGSKLIALSRFAFCDPLQGSS